MLEAEAACLTYIDCRGYPKFSMPKPLPPFAGNAVEVFNKQGSHGVDFSPFIPVGVHHSNDSILTAVTLVPEPDADKLMLQAVTQNIRFTFDGTTPAGGGSPVGFQIVAGDPPIVLTLDPAMIITVIEESATADLEFQWGK